MGSLSYVYDIENQATSLHIPWDLDYTWVDYWFCEAVNHTLIYGFDIEQHCINSNSVVDKLFDQNVAFRKRGCDKYVAFRMGSRSDEAIFAMLNEHEDEIFASGVYYRDMNRWPNGSYVNHANELDEFKSYVKRRLQICDEHYGYLH